MPEVTEQDWLDYQGLLDIYVDQVKEYTANLGESPSVPKPPKPPTFAGWLGEE